MSGTAGTRSAGPATASPKLQSLVRLVPLRLVGLSGLEPLTSRLSGGRSNQLSYRPEDSDPSLPHACALSQHELGQAQRVLVQTPHEPGPGAPATARMIQSLSSAELMLDGKGDPQCPCKLLCCATLSPSCDRRKPGV